MLRLFLKFEINKIIKYFETKTLAKLITSFLFILVFLFIGSGIYHFFISGFRSINIEAVEDIRLALTLFLYEIFLLVLSGIIIFSSLVSSIFNLFRGQNNNWIISSPSYTLFPKFIFIKNLLNSILPILVVFLPAILAFIKVNNLKIFSLFFIGISVLLLVIFLNALTLITLTTLTFIYYKISQIIKFINFNLKGLIILILSIIISSGLIIWKIIINVDLVKLFKADILSDNLNVSIISDHFNFLPTHTVALEIINWQNTQYQLALYNFLIILFLSLVSTFIWWKISHLFYPLWQKFQEGKTQNNLNISSLNKNSYHFNGGVTTAIFKKEILIFTRNWKGILWFGFLLFIWLMQIGANIILGNNIQRYQPDISHKIIILQTLQFIIAIYFISSFTLRFVFPSFSVEKKTSWILLSAPLSFKKIFFGKYLFYTSFFVIIGVLMNYINSLILNLSFINTFYSMILFISVIIFIVTLGLTLGAVFPNFETDDPEIITTSMPGLFFTALALIYGALSDWILYITLNKGNFTLLMSFIAFTFILIIATLIKVPNILKNKGF